MRGVHILITGAAGMMGRKLTERLMRDQNAVASSRVVPTSYSILPPLLPANVQFITVIATKMPFIGRG